MNDPNHQRMGSQRWFVAPAIFLGVLLLCQSPFSVVLEIHHVFAEVDHDGHEHSDFDLCQWVQQHSSGSIVIDPPKLTTLVSGEFDRSFHPENFISSSLVRSFGSRAPPSLVA